MIDRCPTPDEPSATPRFVSASELAEYAYCHRAWWLRAVRGARTVEQTDRFRAGHGAHHRHGAGLRWARVFAALAVLAALAALVGLASRVVAR